MPTPQQVADFLEKLDSDDDFRYNLVNNTAAVLDEYDITYDPGQIKPPSEITIPPKGEVSDNYDYYRDTLFPNNEFLTNDNLWDLPVPPTSN